MSKFRLSVKLQGLEIEIEGHRQEDASVIGRNVAEQIGGLLAPAIQIVEGEAPTTPSPIAHIPAPTSDTAKRKIKRRAAPASGSSDQTASQTIEFRHDPAKYGTPSQQWTTSQKATWLLYVAKEISGAAELSTGQIVKLFNTHFRQAKTVTNSNVSRDLGRLKIASPSQVGEDNAKAPPTWYLTEEGVRQVQALIAQSLMSRAA